MTLAARLRDSSGEVCALVETKGLNAAAASRDVDALIAALEDTTNGVEATASRRLTSEAVFDWLERQGMARRKRPSLERRARRNEARRSSRHTDRLRW